MQRKSILYLMHVPWGWIKQRPHFLAEFLEVDFDLTLRYKRPLRVERRNLTNHSNTIGARGFWQLPLEKMPLCKHFPRALRWINRLLFNRSVPSFRRYDYVWITSLYFYELIRQRITQETFLIWDTMDDEINLPSTRHNRALLERYKKAERELLQRSDIIFCSAEHLAQKILKRNNTAREIIIVNNAIKLPIHHPTPKYSYYNSTPHLFVYIGAVSEWFDFDSLLYAIERVPRARVLIVGPQDTIVPRHPQIEYLGAVEREDIFELMSYAEALIMPFRVSELIESVNPVKLYEYIWADRVVIAPRYTESEKFEEYVWLYTSPQELQRLFEGVISGYTLKKQSTLKNQTFAKENQWSSRYLTIQKELEP